MKQFLIFLIVATVVGGCSNKDKVKNAPAPAPVEEPQTEVDEAREQRLEQQMNNVGNVHTPFRSEIISNAWCEVIDESLSADSINSIVFDSTNHFQLTARSEVEGESEGETTNGAYELRGSVLYLVSGDLEEAASVSLARSAETILLKLTPQDKPSLLYRDCSL